MHSLEFLVTKIYYKFMALAGIDLETFDFLKEWSNRLGYHLTNLVSHQNEKKKRNGSV